MGTLFVVATAAADGSGSSGTAAAARHNGSSCRYHTGFVCAACLQCVWRGCMCGWCGQYGAGGAGSIPAGGSSGGGGKRRRRVAAAEVAAALATGLPAGAAARELLANTARLSEAVLLFGKP